MDSISGLSDAEKKTAVFAAYGIAMLRAHALEKRLAALLFAKTGSDKLHKTTLGPLTEQFISDFSPPRGIADSLRNMLSVRNDLTHRISDKMIASAKSPDWESKLFGELIQVSRTFQAVADALEPYINSWLQENGYAFSDFSPQV